MKALVFLLVLVNVLFYAFSAGYFGGPQNPDAHRVEQQLMPERMRIVSRGEAPKAPAGPPAQAVPAAEGAETKSDEPAASTQENTAAPTPAPTPVVEAEKPSPAPVAAAAEPAACLAWNHLAASDADRARCRRGGNEERRAGRQHAGEHRSANAGTHAGSRGRKTGTGTGAGCGGCRVGGLSGLEPPGSG